MTEKQPKKRNHIILAALLILNILSYIFGVLPPAGRVYYLHTILAETTVLLLFYFVFVFPLVCIGGIIYSVIKAIKATLPHRVLFILWAILFALQLPPWYKEFTALMWI